VLATRDELLRGGASTIDPKAVDLVDGNTVIAAEMGVFPPIFHPYRH
jgi:hypothetical protein